MIREEILNTLNSIGPEAIDGAVFKDLWVEEGQRRALLSSLCSGHHLLILGPPGSGKTSLANNLSTILDDIRVVGGCPMNCSPADVSCPWCIARKARGETLVSAILPAAARLVRVQGSGGLTVEDLIGDLDPEVALREGIYSPTAFLPGKLLRANRCILLIDFIDMVPERVLNVVMYAVQGGTVSLGLLEQKIDLDILVVATGGEGTLKNLPLDLIDNFDVISLGYVDDFAQQKEIVLSRVGPIGEALPEPVVDKAIQIVDETRRHAEVERGVGTRGMLKYVELLKHLPELEYKDRNKTLSDGAVISLPHRLKLAPEVDLPGKREQIIAEIVDKMTGAEEAKEELATLSKEDLLALVEEIVKEDKFRKPLKYGAFDLLLRRIKRFPDSKLAQLYRDIAARLPELYPERYKLDNLDPELLAEVEEYRKEKEKIAQILEQQALARTLQFLEEEDVLERTSSGWMLSLRGINVLLEKLTPRLEEGAYLYGYGKHSAGKKLTVGEGKIVGARRFRFGDKYRDVSFRDTIREAIRNRRQQITREDIIVNIKDIRTRMDIVLVLDLSGTMLQLEKFWFAKESAIALSLAATTCKDRVAVVSFSNLADVVVDLASSPHTVTRRVLDLELHENAFTNIGYGLLKACDLLEHHPKGRAKQHIILISDGDATAPHPSPQKYALRQAARVARRGITISCICINQRSADPELMRRIARTGRGRIYLIGAEDLPAVLIEEAAAARISY
ncbi:VWA domain-containing protein [Chloroflexota bacterium]